MRRLRFLRGRLPDWRRPTSVIPRFSVEIKKQPQWAAFCLGFFFIISIRHPKSKKDFGCLE
jgi:hypothetical protein